MCAIDPHQMHPEHDILRSQVEAWDRSLGSQIRPYISRQSTTVTRISLCNAHLGDDEINYISLVEKLDIVDDERTEYVTNEFTERLTLISRGGQSGQLRLNTIAPDLKWIGPYFDHFFSINIMELRLNPPYVTTHDSGSGRVRRLKGVLLELEHLLDSRVTSRPEELKGGTARRVILKIGVAVAVNYRF